MPPNAPGPTNLFAYPDLPRFGLGNVLIPWARAEVFSHRFGVPILAPQWIQPKIGPLLRGERDLRLYLGYFSNTQAGYLRGGRRAALLRSATRYPHTEAAKAVEAAAANPTSPHVVVFKFPEWGDPFFDGDAPAGRDIIARRLREILAPGMARRLARARAALPPRYIAMHVRRGDKKVMPKGEKKDVYNDSIWVMQDDWYLEVLRHVRRMAGTDLPAVVFSDASDAQLAGILQEPAVVRAPKSPSIIDILLLADGAILIGTGTSSFSLWAGLLGEMPSLWYAGVAKMVHPERPELIIETGEDGSVPDHAAPLLRTAAAATPARGPAAHAAPGASAR